MGINIKGITTPALMIKLDRDQSVDANLAELEDKLSSTVLQGSLALISYDDIELSDDDKSRFEDVLSKYNARCVGFRTYEEDKVAQKKAISGINDKSLKIINKMVRSGQRIEHMGDILIIGDVNPDSYVIASGNVIVMGTLRGIVHAGAGGDENVTVMALKLTPQQLRISSYIARSPDDEPDLAEYPERAYVKDNQIIIEKL